MTLRTNSIRILLAVFLMIINAIAASCSRNNVPEVVSLRVGILKDLTAGPDILANVRGFFKTEGLNVTFVRLETGAEACSELLKGNLEIANTAEYVAATNIINNQPVVIIGSASKYDGVLLAARKSSGIHNVTGLKGSRVGINTDTVNYLYLSRLLERNGLNLNDITAVNGTQSGLVELYNKGDIDSVVFSRVYVNRLIPQYDLLTWPAQGNQTGYRVAAVRPEWVTPNRVTIEKYLRALARAEDFILENETDTKMIIAVQQNLEQGYIESEWPSTRFELSLDLALLAVMNDEADWIIKTGRGAAQIPDFAAFFYPDGLKAVKPEAVTIIR